ncbi:MAG: protease complex subunit PrcB family protein [Phycisphaerales bacterium]|nr:protease complex subunit PrcB family protein [Phycisphaerales bacterium]
MPGCHDGHGNIRQLPPDGEELPILEQYAGKHSHESRSMQLVIRDAATFARIPLQDNVPVDFENQMLLIVTLGRVPSDQYGVNVERVWREGHKLHVATAVQSPAPNAPLAMASPYCIVVIPRCDLNVVGFDPEPGQRVRSWSQSEPGMLP